MKTELPLLDNMETDTGLSYLSRIGGWDLDPKIACMSQEVLLSIITTLMTRSISINTHNEPAKGSPHLIVAYIHLHRDRTFFCTAAWLILNHPTRCSLNQSLLCPVTHAVARTPWIDNLGCVLAKVTETVMTLKSPLRWCRPPVWCGWHVRDKLWLRTPEGGHVHRGEALYMSDTFVISKAFLSYLIYLHLSYRVKTPKRKKVDIFLQICVIMCNCWAEEGTLSLHIHKVVMMYI